MRQKPVGRPAHAAGGREAEPGPTGSAQRARFRRPGGRGAWAPSHGCPGTLQFRPFYL